jgi:hypothetical protein
MYLVIDICTGHAAFTIDGLVGLQQIYSESSMTDTDTNNQAHLTAF